MEAATPRARTVASAHRERREERARVAEQLRERREEDRQSQQGSAERAGGHLDRGLPSFVDGEGAREQSGRDDLLEHGIRGTAQQSGAQPVDEGEHGEAEKASPAEREDGDQHGLHEHPGRRGEQAETTPLAAVGEQPAGDEAGQGADPLHEADEARRSE
ncbi:hypothetical protein [Brachybacterium sp. AG952]|uniref:hypothetical protein n=1 Tax=Brachybacterium sp. AG952 TaxID=2183989 RepID=UPI001FB5A42A|nr:hypothetical protein [Brachybacterium sp. AG952]